MILDAAVIGACFGVARLINIKINSEIHCPIFNAANPKSQKNDIPPSLIVQNGLNEKK
jgi:hypothetical protein